MTSEKVVAATGGHHGQEVQVFSADEITKYILEAKNRLKNSEFYVKVKDDFATLTTELGLSEGHFGDVRFVVYGIGDLMKISVFGERNHSFTPAIQQTALVMLLCENFGVRISPETAEMHDLNLAAGPARKVLENLGFTVGTGEDRGERSAEWIITAEDKILGLGLIACKNQTSEYF